jgi:preprotein translocase subunit SecY
MQMAQAAGLRSRILVTLGLLVLVRLGIFIPVPGIDRPAFAQSIQSGNLGGFCRLSGHFCRGRSVSLRYFCPRDSALYQCLNYHAAADGGSARSWKICKRMKGKLGGVRSLRLPAMLLWVGQFCKAPCWRPSCCTSLLKCPVLLFVVQTVIALTAGSMFVMWVGELITERGIGNGASLLIFSTSYRPYPGRWDRPLIWLRVAIAAW